MILSPDYHLVTADGTYLWTRERVIRAWASVLQETETLIKEQGCKSLTLLVGLPASGKTTWLREHAVDDVLYVDAVFSTKFSRSSFIHIASLAEKPIVAVHLGTTYEECVRRNDLRAEDRRVPCQFMEKFRAELSADPPSLEEGFSEVFSVVPY